MSIIGVLLKKLLLQYYNQTKIEVKILLKHIEFLNFVCNDSNNKTHYCIKNFSINIFSANSVFCTKLLHQRLKSDSSFFDFFYHSKNYWCMQRWFKLTQQLSHWHLCNDKSNAWHYEAKFWVFLCVFCFLQLSQDSAIDQTNFVTSPL